MNISRENNKTQITIPGWMALFMSMILGMPMASVAIEALSYDLKGNIISRQNNGGTTNYQYDNLDRLTDEQGPLATQGFTYDANGNRLTDGAGSYTYEPNSNVMATEHGNTVVRDDAGNQTDNGQGLTFEYSQVGRIKRVFNNSTLVATYTYNAFGQRTRKVTPGGATVYHYDLNGQLIEETLDNGSLQSTYVWRNNKPTAVIYEPSTPSNGTALERTVYLHSDHTVTPRSATDDTKTTVWQWQSDAFGGSSANTDPDTDGNQTVINLRLPGQYFDQETGLHYNYFRYYDPGTGRYLTVDPIGLSGGPNTFSYASVNPLNYTDTFGLQSSNPVNDFLAPYIPDFISKPYGSFIDKADRIFVDAVNSYITHEDRVDAIAEVTYNAAGAVVGTLGAAATAIGSPPLAAVVALGETGVVVNSIRNFNKGMKRLEELGPFIQKNDISSHNLEDYDTWPLDLRDQYWAGRRQAQMDFEYNYFRTPKRRTSPFRSPKRSTIPSGPSQCTLK